MDDRLNCSQPEALPEIGSVVPAGPHGGCPYGSPHRSVILSVHSRKMAIRDVRKSARGWPNRTVESKGARLRRSRERPLTVTLIPPCGRSISPCCWSAEKSRARFFAPLRCAQNDSMADECTDVTLSSATDPSKAKDLRADVLERSPPFLLADDEPAAAGPQLPIEEMPRSFSRKAGSG